jgi:hypothetical protein
MRTFMSAAVLLLIGMQPPSGQQPLRRVQSIELPRVEGRIDLGSRQAPSTSSAIPTTSSMTPGARTSLFVPYQDRLYLAVPHRGAQKAEIRVYEVRD